MSFPARPHESVRPSPAFLTLLAATTAGGVLAWLAGSSVRPLSYVAVFVFVVAGWLVSTGSGGGTCQPAENTIGR